MLQPQQIKHWIETELKNSHVEVEGDGQHFNATIVSAIFSGKSALERHRLVYTALGDKMQTQIHALSLQTYAPNELDMNEVTMKIDMKVEEKIKQQISSSPVVLYMKGTPDFPQCGFSGKVVYILRRNEIDFVSHNVLEDAELRQGIKDFSNWPTIPQLYVKGRFIGGCDIVNELYEKGELRDLLGE